MRVRGLKQLILVGYLNNLIVAPRAGAWIETLIVIVIAPLLIVAPRAGAWIETSKSS